jgi:hypothetical protein
MSNEEAAIEAEIQAKGLNAARLRPQDIDAQIMKAEYHVFGGRLTVCALSLRNGFMVTGESACASAENFDEAIGQKVAYDIARNKIWAFEGYVLRNKIRRIGMRRLRIDPDQS